MNESNAASGTDRDCGDRGAPPPPTERPDVPSWKLMATLSGAGAIAGLVLVMVYQWTLPAIQAHQALVLREAIQEVLAEPDRYETLYVIDGALTGDLPAGTDSMAVERVYLGFDAGDRPVGFAVAGGEPGFQDIVRILFGYDAAADRVLGMKVLESRETPGLGDKIEKDSSFVASFRGAAPPLVGVKVGRATGDENEVDIITGATISSRTLIDIINHRLEELGPVLRAYPVLGAQAAGGSPVEKTEGRADPGVGGPEGESGQ